MGGTLDPPEIMCGLKVTHKSCLPNGYIKWESDYQWLLTLPPMGNSILVVDTGRCCDTKTIAPTPMSYLLVTQSVYVVR